MRPSIVRWEVLGIICIASFVSYVLRTNLSITGETMMKDLGLTQIQLGFVLSAFAWGYALFQFPGGVFGDVAGPRKAITIVAVFWGIFTFLTALVPGPATASVTVILIFLIAIRFLVGAAHAPIFPVIGGTIGNWFPVSGWALPNGLTSSALTLGAAATAPLIVWLMQNFGWRESYFITAPLGFLIAGLWWWYVRDYPYQHRAVNRSELELIELNRDPPPTGAGEKTGWKLTVKNRNILLLALSYFCMNYVFYLFFNWFFYYLVEVRKVQQEEAGLLNAVQWVAGALGAAAGGYLCDRFARKYGARWGYRLVPVPSLILSGIFLFLGAITKDSYLAVLLFSFSFGCTQLTEGSYWGAVVSVAGRHAASGGGVLNTGGNVVGGIGAILVPVLAESFGWNAAVMSGAAFALIGAALWLFIRADVPMEKEGF